MADVLINVNDIGMLRLIEMYVKMAKLSDVMSGKMTNTRFSMFN